MEGEEITNDEIKMLLNRVGIDLSLFQLTCGTGFPKLRGWLQNSNLGCLVVEFF